MTNEELLAQVNARIDAQRGEFEAKLEALGVKFNERTNGVNSKGIERSDELKKKLDHLDDTLGRLAKDYSEMEEALKKEAKDLEDLAEEIKRVQAGHTPTAQRSFVQNHPFIATGIGVFAMVGVVATVRAVAARVDVTRESVTVDLTPPEPPPLSILPA